MTNETSPVPYLLRFATMCSPGAMPNGGVITTEDPFPAVVEIDSNGLAVGRGTRITDVKQETLDDN